MDTTITQLLNLSNKVAVVTGGAKGIGLGIVKRLHEAGATVVIVDFDDASAENEAKSLNVKRADSALAVKADVSKKADIEKVLAKTLDGFKKVDILVNDAGIFPNQPLAKMDDDDFMKVINVNLRSVFLTTEIIGGQMIKQGEGGKIINVTSIDALHPSMVGLAHYDASKHGVWGFTKNSALELAEHKIWVNAIAPGGIATPGVAAMQDASKMPKDIDMKKVTEAFMAKIPMHRMGEPDEIGKVALFLASELSSYMTGEQIVVDGGALLS